MQLPDQALWNAFADGARVILEREVCTTRIIDAGYLALPSGQILAGDPVFDIWNKPLSTRVPPGDYQVLLSLIRDDVGLAMVHFGAVPRVWQACEPSHVSVDCASACLMDFRAARFLRRKADAGKYDRYSERFMDALKETDGLWADERLDAVEANVILFRTWGGDGCFPCYFGFDDHGEPSCLVVDMCLHSHALRVELPD